MNAGIRVGLAMALTCIAICPAVAGPPFLTDDPEPTDSGHWEIYAPLLEAEGRGQAFDGTAGVELNYGAAPGLQLTADLPIAFAHDSGGWTHGVGDLGISAKYRFYHDDEGGLSVAAFPGISIPTAGRSLGAGKVTAFFPLWAQKNVGAWSIFGGGGYALNAGQDSRDNWSGGLAVTREIGKRLLLGVEADRQGPVANDERASTSLGFGAIYRLKGPFRLLASGGPTLRDGGGPASFHMFAALGIDF